MFFSWYYNPVSGFNKLIYKTKSTSELQYQLSRAVLSNNLAKMKALLAFKVSPNFAVRNNLRDQESYGESIPWQLWHDLPLLHVAAMANSIEALDLLLKYDANVHVARELKNCTTSGSILHNVMQVHTHLPIYERLIDAGASVIIANENGITVLTALLSAYSFYYTSSHIREDKIAILKLLISKGAMPHKQDIPEILALVGSKRNVNDKDLDIELLQMCLDKKIDLASQSRKLLHCILSNLKEVSDVRLEFIKKILAMNIPLNLQDDKGRTVFYLATENSCPKVIRLLLDHLSVGNDIKFAINIADDLGITPFHLAAKNNKECLWLLFHNGANIKAKDISLCATAAHYAADNSETMQSLLVMGASFDEPDIYGTTPLMLAVKAGNFKNVKLLINSGANILAENENQESVLSLAKFNKEIWPYVQDAFNKQRAGVSGQALTITRV